MAYLKCFCKRIEIEKKNLSHIESVSHFHVNFIKMSKKRKNSETSETSASKKRNITDYEWPKPSDIWMAPFDFRHIRDEIKAKILAQCDENRKSFQRKNYIYWSNNVLYSENPETQEQVEIIRQELKEIGYKLSGEKDCWEISWYKDKRDEIE